MPDKTKTMRSKANRTAISSKFSSHPKPSMALLENLINNKIKGRTMGKLKTAIKVLALAPYAAMPAMRLRVAENPKAPKPKLQRYKPILPTGLPITQA